MSMSIPLEIMDLTRACALSSEEICIACSPTVHDVGHPFTRLSTYKRGVWSHVDFEFWVCSITVRRELGERNVYCAGKNGEVVDLQQPKALSYIRKPDEKKLNEEGFGNIECINAIDQCIFACGDGGQNYKRYQNGNWEVIDENVLDRDVYIDAILNNQPPEGLSEQETIEFNMQQMLSGGWDVDASNSATKLTCVEGVSENSLFFCGGKGNLQSVLLHWNGLAIKSLIDQLLLEGKNHTPSLNHILLEDGEDKIRVCGQQGAMLVGNAADGFVQDPAAFNTEILYYKMAKYRNMVYLATSLGLHVHDGNQIMRVRTGLEPDAFDTHTVEAVDDVLWVVGSKDILRFDGNSWERIQYPGNPPV